MKTYSKCFSFFVLFLLSLTGMSQVLDGAYIRESVPQREYIPYQYIREADAMYSKKILRVIEMTEKINHPLYFPITRITFPSDMQPPRQRVNFLFLVYYIGVLGHEYDLTGRLLEDETPDYSRRYPVYELDPSDITNWYRIPLPQDTTLRDSLLAYFETIREEDEFGDLVDRTIRVQMYDTRAMDRLWLWEEWVFDKQRSIMEARIIAIAPDGEVVAGEGVQRVWPFWIQYIDYRPLLASNEVFNPYNDAEHRTFDDIFFKRRFSSYIVAETNVYDNRLIEDFLLGIDAVREGERIQDVLFKFEHDQWEY